MAVQDYEWQGSARRFFKMNAKTCELTESVKNGEVYEDIKRKGIEWSFVKLLVEKKTFEGKETEFLKLILSDEGEQYEINTSRSKLWQQLVNSLAGELANGNKLWNVAVSVGSKKTDNGKEYARLYIKNNAEPMKWKYSIDEQKSMIEIIKNSKWEYKGKDETAYLEALRACIIDINLNDPSLSTDSDLPF